jgi:NAD-dependent dihydropyrimidine dehydrogenase PreA subunit
MVDDLAGDSAGRVALPTIDCGRCLRALSVHASCRACVESCPTQALRLEENGLYVDVHDCDGCSACVAACPEKAIAVPVEPSLGDATQGYRAFAACRSTELPHEAGGAAFVPCLNGLGLESLAQLYQRGVRELVLASAPCGACPSGPASRIEARVSSFNCLLPPGPVDQVRIVELPPVEWRRRRDAAVDAAQKAVRSAIAKGAEFARRALLTESAAADESAEGEPEEPHRRLSAPSRASADKWASAGEWSRARVVSQLPQRQPAVRARPSYALIAPIRQLV